MSNSICVPTSTGIARVDTAWHDPDRADVVFLVVQDGSLGMFDQDCMVEWIARIWADDRSQEEEWDTLMIKTCRMSIPLPCTVEKDRQAKDPTAVFRTADGVGRYTMKI